MRIHRPVLVLAVLLGLAAPSPARPAVSRPAPRAAAVSPLPWIHDDWPRAVALARARKVPIFVENWAPW